jgi:hypothetical protein
MRIDALRVVATSEQIAVEEDAILGRSAARVEN